MRWFILPFALMLAACDVDVVDTTSAPPPDRQVQTQRASGSGISPEQFRRVVAQIEPVAEDQCRRRTSGVKCNYLVQVDTRRNQPPNAFQTLRDDGRPVIIFNVALLADLDNADELAFVFAHEAAHHIRGHLTRLNQNAQAGAATGAIVGAILGVDPNSVDSLAQAGALVGARSYSKAFELEADELGTIIAARAGFDPVRGARYFMRIDDPGNTFLGTHPPNAERIETVRRTAARL
ncbi:MAG: M48 family metalloprotease [Pseudomonadota bacterium]